jgi:hypothetical protein
MKHDMEKVLNMKLELRMFKTLSDKKLISIRAFFARTIFNIFGCELGVIPFMYLGIPSHFCKLKNSEWKVIEDCFERKLAS